MKLSRSFTNEDSLLYRFINFTSELFPPKKISRSFVIISLILSYLQIFTLIVDPYNDFMIKLQNVSDPYPLQDLLFDILLFCKFANLYTLYSNYPSIYLFFFGLMGVVTISFTSAGLAIIFIKKPQVQNKEKIMFFMKLIAKLYDSLYFLPAQIVFLIAVSALTSENYAGFNPINDSYSQEAFAGLGIFFCISNTVNGFLMSFYGENPLEDGIRKTTCR